MFSKNQYTSTFWCVYEIRNVWNIAYFWLIYVDLSYNIWNISGVFQIFQASFICTTTKRFKNHRGERFDRLLELNIVHKIIAVLLSFCVSCLLWLIVCIHIWKNLSLQLLVINNMTNGKLCISDPILSSITYIDA